MAEDFWGALDDIACAVVGNKDPARYSIPGPSPVTLSPFGLSMLACDCLGVDEIDLFGPFDFDGAPQQPAPVVLGLYAVALLRFNVFSEARARKAVNDDFLSKMIAHSELTARMLRDHWLALRAGDTSPTHRWLH